MISVIVPAYNAEAFLRQCVESVIGQTLDGWELVLVDDGSSDSTPALCDAFASADSRIRAVHKPNGGLSDARNAGIDAASGEWLLFLDADDVLAPGALAVLLGLAREYGADIACADFFSSPEAASPRSWRARYRRGVLAPEEAVERMLYQRGLNHSACGKLYAARLFSSTRFRKGTWFEDLDLFYRVFLEARRVAVTPEPLYLYRANPSSFLHRFTLARADVLTVCDRLCAYMAANRPALLPAARDRRLSAAFNIYGLMAANAPLPGEEDRRRAIAARCREIIKETRFGSLRDPKVRLKNKIGVIAACVGGFPLLRLLSRAVYR